MKFDDVDTGESGTFPHNHRIMFSGDVTLEMCFNIECWESDYSEFFAGLGNLLDVISEAANRGAKYVRKRSGGLAAKKEAVLRITAVVADVVSQLISVFNNDDDCIGERTFEIDRAGLEATKRSTWRFERQYHGNTNGIYDLTIAWENTYYDYFAGHARRLGAGSAGQWTNVSTPSDWKPLDAPAYASYNGLLYAVYPDQEHRVMWRTYGAKWGPAQQIVGDQSFRTVSLAVHDNRLYYVVLGLDTAYYHWRSFDGTAWGPISQAHTGSEYAPVLASGGGALWLVVGWADGGIQLRRFNGSSFDMVTETGWVTSHRPSAVVYDGDLHVAHRGEADDYLHIGRRDGNNQSYIPDASWRSNAGPGITVHENRVCMAHLGTDGRSLYFANQTPDGSWTPALHPPGIGNGVGEPSLVSHNGELHLFYWTRSPA